MRSNEPLTLHSHVRVEYLLFGEPNSVVLLTWQRRGSGMRSGEPGGECGKEAAVLRGSEERGAISSSATIEGREDAAARLWRAGSWRQQRGSGGRGGGGSAALELGRGVVSRIHTLARRGSGLMQYIELFPLQRILQSNQIAEQAIRHEIKWRPPKN